MTNNLHNFKTIVVLFLLVSNLIQSLYAQNYNMDWAKRIGGSSGDESKAIAIDAMGNVYTTGNFTSDTMDFDPGSATYNLLTSYRSIFISKLDASGNFQWAKRWGGGAVAAFSNCGESIIADISGNIYVTGYFIDTLAFNSFNVPDLISNGNKDMFIIKLDNSGNVSWAKSIGGSSDDYGYSVTTDVVGNVYITGTFGGTVDFDPGAGVASLIGGGLFSPHSFVLKLNSLGNYVWAKQMGGTGQCVSSSITAGTPGNIVVTGHMKGTIDFDPSLTIANLTANSNIDIFICKFDTSGNFIWAKNMGDSGYAYSANYANSVIADASGNIYTTGSFNETTDFDPGTSTFNLVSNGNDDIFISKLDSTGNFVWAKQIGGIGDDQGNSIILNPSGNMVYLSGSFRGIDSTAQSNIDFNPGLGIFNVSTTAIGAFGHFVCQLDTSGNFVWAGQIVDDGGSGNTFATGDKGIAVNNEGSIYTTGSFSAEGDFDPGLDTFNLTSAGESDIFIHKMSRCYIMDTITTNACDSFIFDNQTYTQSGFYTDTISHIGSCDSFITLNLSLGHTSSDTFSEAGCDSIIFNGETYTASGNYVQNFISIEGCDSTIILTLTIGHTPDTSVLQTGTTLVALASNAAYQWVNCDNGTAIPGATDQSFTPLANGHYAVIVTGSGGCSNSSNCYAITGISGINELKDGNKVRIYPNPAHNLIIIKAEKALSDATIRVTNSIGKIVAGQSSLRGTVFQLDIASYPPGFYMVEIIEVDKTVRIELVKE